MIVIIEYDETTDYHVFNILCTAVVFNCIWVLVQRLFKEVKLQEGSTQQHSFLLAQPASIAVPETMV